MTNILQGSAEVIQWAFDFADMLQTGDSISGTPVASASDGATATPGTIAGDIVPVTVSGVPFGAVVRVSCTVDTSFGETLTREAAIRGGER